MKKLFLIGLLALTFVRLTPAQPQQIYINRGLVTTHPPQIDAITFDNEGAFEIGVNSASTNFSTGGLTGVLFFDNNILPFDFSDVLYYTNRNIMSSDTGFTFDDAISGFTNGNPRKPSASFGNANTGQVLAGSVSNFFGSSLVFFGISGLSFLSGTPNLTISATNIVNTGLLDSGSDGLISITGNNINLVRGTTHVEGFDEALITQNIGQIGIMDNYWGIGSQTNQLEAIPATGPIPGNLNTPYPASPFNLVTNNVGLATISFVTPIPYGVAYANQTTELVGTNLNTYTQVVFVNTNLTGISTDVRFIGGGSQFGTFATPIIQWEAVLTNNNGFSQTLITNDLYLEDQYGSRMTNFLITNNFTLSGVPQPQPYNYTFLRFFPGYTNLPPGNTPFTTFLYANAFPPPATNAYSAYGVTLTPVTSFPDPTLPGSTVTNTPGRIEINANTVLDLTRSKITGPNYLKLNSTNHFVGAPNAQIVSPYMDVFLGSTNGTLNVSNVVAPYIPRFTGPIDMWSGRWTNNGSLGTNFYHVLIVNAQLSPTALPLVLNASLRAPNVVVSDDLNIDQTLLVNASNLTISSNGPGSLTPYGAINTFSPDIIWSASFPSLQNLTNFGLISAENTTFFENLQQNPYYQTDAGQPYASFVNHGLITTAGNVIAASYFENTGVGLFVTNSTGIIASNIAEIYSAVGPIDLQAQTALMTNGTFIAPAGDISIAGGSITISNHDVLTGGALTLSATTLLTDLGGSSSNFWSVNDGMNLVVKPPTGDLLGTTITNFCPPGLEVQNIWAGEDRGPNNSGYSNDEAVGHLILDGGDDNSTFYFGGPDFNKKYAIYVDLLDLRDGATNREPAGGTQIFTAFDIADNFTIYFAEAVMGNGVDISEKLNDGVHLVWVPSYTGAFSGTNLVTPSGATNVVNRAVFENYGTNGYPSGGSKVFSAQNLKLSISMSNLPPMTPVIQWTGFANSTNTLYYKSSFEGSKWQVVTNFVQGPVTGTVTFVDRGRTNSVGYYKVQAQAQQP